VRSIAILLTLLAAPALAQGPVQAPLAVPVLAETALFGLNWGDPVLQGMVPEKVSADPETEFYRRPSDKLELDGVPLILIMYGYEDSGLAGISIQFSWTQRDRLVEALVRRWGQPMNRPDGATLWFTPTSMAVLKRLAAPDDHSGNLNLFARPDAAPMSRPR
jgi:hypothetical protein